MTIDAATMKKLRKWDDGGMTRREMARRSGISAKTLTKYLGPKDRNIGDRPRVMVNVWTHREDFRKVAQMAKDLGYKTSAGHTAGSGSVGLLIEALAAGDVVVQTRADYEQDQELLDREYGTNTPGTTYPTRNVAGAVNLPQ